LDTVPGVSATGAPATPPRPERKSRRTLRYRLGGGQPYLRALDNRFQPGVPTTDDFGGPLEKGVPSATAEARPFL
jgi:hypothetical protein